MGTTTWTDESVKFLRDNWDRMSATAIGDVLRVSRSAVIGKVYRLGLYKRRPRKKAMADYRPKVKPSPGPLPEQRGINGMPFVPLPPPPKSDDATLGFGPRTSTLELTHNTCRWPIGHPGTADFFFCGAVPVRGAPYCDRHCAIAWPRRASA